MTRKLKIALVVDAIEVGGVETFLFNLQRFFQSKGHHASIVACKKRGAWWDMAQSMGISCVCVSRSRLWSKASHARKVGKFLTEQGYDCILLNHSVYGQASLGMLPQHVIAIPVIHGDQSSIYKLACSNSAAWNIAIGVSKKLTDTAKLIAPDKPIKTIFHGVRSPPIDSINNRAKLDGTIKLLFVGRIFHDTKGVLYLPEILNGCINRGIDAILTIVGNGDCLHTLKKRIVKLNISNRILMVEEISQDCVYEKMLEHHILLMPSHFEGFGLVAVEAQACGCVPIASRLPGVTDQTIDHEQTGLLVNIGAIDTFVSYIEKLYKEPLLWRTMSEHGISKVEKKFSATAMGQAYLHVIHDALLGKYPLQVERKQSQLIDKSIFAL